MTQTNASSNRLSYLDWLRGLGAVIMLQGHAFNSFLKPELRNEGAYTRYADDLTFSAPQVKAHNLHLVRHDLSKLVAREGFVIHPGKTRVLRRGRRQEVTGVVVNRGLNVPRDVMRRFRATLYQVEKDVKRLRS